MSVFKNLGKLAAVGKENMAQTQSAIASIDYTEHDAPPDIAPDDAVEATAVVVRFAETNAVVDIHPVVQLELLVLRPDTAPRPLTIRPALALGQVPLVQRGATVPITLSVADPNVATIDWARQT